MTTQQNQIDNVLNLLYKEAKNDRYKIIKSLAESRIRPIQPMDFKDVFLSISSKQGTYLKQIIQDHNLKNIIEFGTSFGISTLFLAQGILKTGGKIITTELIESKAKQAVDNFKKAEVNHLIDLRVGDAMHTLKNHSEPIDLLFLDGWKDLYFPLFKLLEPNFHKKTFVYVDNADMNDTQDFLQKVRQDPKYHLNSKYNGKVFLITHK
ncbi:putative O-methyltransferase YrrM [Wenyingzhuangia heitensis]|uniref:O-methyltransferase YrrM n=1 Tax=Wenyingzhuangia heitensis TaxID=1487859 RepID=A0ABX0UDW7_9FLAO|nr:class I SAM-dependent methyltransferase [Wenyingzhuangia heitensis]NIJ45641.1 putative O-methyltransferase YrrM [Wenyingzhuangia heitensis]